MYLTFREHTLSSIPLPLQEHRDSHDKNDIRDVIDLLFAEVEKRKTSGRVDGRFEKDSFDDEAIRGNVFGLFIDGTETTSTTLLWLVMFMALHPNIQREVKFKISVWRIIYVNLDMKSMDLTEISNLALYLTVDILSKTAID